MNYIKMFIDYLENNLGKTEKTAEDYERYLNEFKAFIDEKNIDIKEVAREVINEFIASLRNKKTGEKVSAMTKHVKMAAVKSFYRYMEESDYMSYNPASKIRNIKINRKPQRFLNEEEVWKLIDVVEKHSGETKKRDLAIVWTLLSAGLRKSELISLDIGCLNGRLLTVCGKGGKYRVLALIPETISAIQTYLDSRNDNNEAMFVSYTGNRLSPSGLDKIIKGYLKRMGKDACVHSLRHAFCSMEINNNTNLESIKKMMGHSSLTTTQYYFHMNNEKHYDEMVENHPMRKNNRPSTN